MVGIAGIGVSLPDNLVDVWEVIAPVAKTRITLKDKLGCNFVPMAREDEGPMLFCLNAAREALEEAGVKPEQIDVVISNNLSADYEKWQGSAYVADQLGCHKATTFDVYGGCNTTGCAYSMARDLLVSDEDVEYVLIALTEHCGGGTFPQFIGDGACALVMTRHSERLQHIEYYNLNEFMPSLGVMKEGGLKYPFTPETRFDGGWEDNVDWNIDKYRKEIKPIFHEMSTRPILAICEKAGIKVTDLDQMFIVHQQAVYHEKVLDTLGLPRDAQPIHYIENLGHISGFDVFIALKWALRDGLVKKGDLLGFMAMGLGEWHTMLLRA